MNDMNKIYTTGFITKEDIDVEERTLVGIASSPTIDRHREIITYNAWQLENFRTHPVIFISHRHSLENWIAKALWVKATKKGLLFKAQFATSDAAKEIFQTIVDLEMAAFSIGARMVEWSDMTISELPDNLRQDIPKEFKSSDIIRVHKKVELREISVVGLPANPTSVLVAAKKGLIKSVDTMNELQSILDEFELDDGSVLDDIEEPVDILIGVDKTKDAEDNEEDTVENQINVDEKEWLYLIHHMHPNQEDVIKMETLHHCDLFSKKGKKGDTFSQRHIKNNKKGFTHVIDVKDIEEVPGVLYDHLDNEFEIKSRAIGDVKYAAIKRLLNKCDDSLVDNNLKELREVVGALKAEIDTLKEKGIEQSAGIFDLEGIESNTEESITKEELELLNQAIDKKLQKAYTHEMASVVRTAIARAQGRVQ